MEAGAWVLDKVEMDVLKESMETFVFLKKHEPPGARARVALSGLTVHSQFLLADR